MDGGGTGPGRLSDDVPESGGAGGVAGGGAPSLAEVLDAIALEDVYALGTDGTERVDWAALVEDRSDRCPECGEPDGPRHYRSCLAHPRRPSRWWTVFACFVLPLPLILVVGPGAIALFAPLFLLTWFIATR